MNTNQNKPLTSFLPANASPPAAAGTTPKAGVWDDRLAAEIATEISPEAAKGRQTPPTLQLGEIEISPEAAKGRQTPPTETLDAEVEPTEESLDAENEGDAASPVFRRVDDRLVAEIASGTSLAEAARRAGVSERTAQRRWADLKFRRKCLEARCQIRWEVVGLLNKQMQKATDTLALGMDAKSESVRVSAARAILKIGSEMGGQQEENALLEEKLESIQAEMKSNRDNEES
jgi:hypothetical protein